MAIGGLLNTAWEAITSNQIAMNVTGANIANVNTPGYTRQRADFSAVGSIDRSGQGSMGIKVDGVERLYNRYLETQIIDQAQKAGYDAARSEILGRVEGVFNESAGSGLSETLTQFWNSWEALSSDPTNQVVRYAVVAAANNLTSLFRENSNVLSTAQQDIQDSMTATVKDINSLTTEIAGLNNQILALGTEDGSANNLLDRRMESLKNLADKVNISYYENSDGTVNVFLGSGSSLVGGNTSQQLNTIKNSAGNIDIVFKNNPTQVLNDAITGGRLGAMIETGETTVAGYLDGLNQLADGIVKTVNDLHTNGWATDTKVDNVIPTAGNGYAGEVSSGGVYNGTVNKNYRIKIAATDGAFGTAQYQISTNGGAYGTVMTTPPSGIITVDGIELTFDATKPLVAGDTFTVNAYVNGIESAFGIDNAYAGVVSSSGDYTGDVNKTYAMKITNGGTFASGLATYQISSDGGKSWGANVPIPGTSSGNISLGSEGINLTFADPTISLVKGDIFYVNAYPHGKDAVFFDTQLTGAKNMQISTAIKSDPQKVVAPYDLYRAERIRGQSWLTTTESSLAGVSDLLLQAQEVAQNGDTATNRINAIQTLKDKILSLANTQFADRYIFAGTDTHNRPFDPTTYAYSGNTTSLSVNIGDNTNYSITGGTVFPNAFTALDTILTNLGALGDPTSTASVSTDKVVAANQLVQDNIAKTRTMASNFGQANIGEQARQIGAARDTLSMNGGAATFNDFYAALVGQVGYDVKAADAGIARNTAVTNQLMTQRDSVSGVSMDEEVINLMKYQFGYNTAARLVKSANDMLDVLMALGK